MHAHKNTDYTYRNHCWIFRDFLGRNKLPLPKYNTQTIAVYYVRLSNKSPSAHLKRILSLAALKSIRGTISLYQAHLQKLRGAWIHNGRREANMDPDIYPGILGSDPSHGCPRRPSAPFSSVKPIMMSQACWLKEWMGHILRLHRTHFGMIGNGTKGRERDEFRQFGKEKACGK